MALTGINKSPMLALEEKCVVIGIYGVPGSGKSFLVKELKARLSEEHFRFYEGSEVIASQIPGGLEEFQQASAEAKTIWRQSAIKLIGNDGAGTKQAAVVTGHFMFWPEEDETGHEVYTQEDLDTYTHILYLDTAPDVAARREDRASASLPQQRNPFVSVSDPETTLDRVAAMLLDFRYHTKERNLSFVLDRLDEALAANRSRDRLQTALVLDADRTLAAQDTGELFWRAVSRRTQQNVASIAERADEDPLKTLFGSQLKYSYTAFRQATLLYEEVSNDDEFDAICQEVAFSVSLYPEMASLLRYAGEKEHVTVIVVTCGLRRIWDMVLAREGLSGLVKVVGGGRIADGYVITAEVKRALAARLRDTHGLYIWAFGDSVLDLPMLQEAHQAIVVVGEEPARSRTMDEPLLDAIDNGGLWAHQVLLPSHTSLRLDAARLPVLQLRDPEFLDSVVRERDASSRIFHATSHHGAKLLTTATRNANVRGPALRNAHRLAGWYLAIEFLAGAVGVEEYDIPHVLSHPTKGHRVRHEEKTTIVALMRGGEPMAFGVNDALPLAMFVHARQPDDLERHHLQMQRTVVLVDSVVNNGTTVMEFVQRIRRINPSICILVLAGVVQSQSVSSSGILGRVLRHEKNLSLIALRFSDNKFTGSGATDTGNRLFNTTQLA
ncbi:Uracil phosphoribosyltransferase [Madurella mycetomatis]|uniref:Uracil phosphoribosyltransferase n=1 Tax=Madurella mycetomatis TaxID=100816 RepID=A0A175VRI3_9PEZI|nr:Uracil phosphoribosyltransferase [Madurella mycetomatis]